MQTQPDRVDVHSKKREFATDLRTCPSTKSEMALIFLEFQKRSLSKSSKIILGVDSAGADGGVRGGRAGIGLGCQQTRDLDLFRLEMATATARVS
jgi:hypothetical protein